MKKNRWRQGAASVAAAAVLWLAAVCAGSDDLASAAAAVRQSELARCLLQWELADLLPTDSLPLPALLALGPTPQLLAAQEALRRLHAGSPEHADAPAPPPPPPGRRRSAPPPPPTPRPAYGSTAPLPPRPATRPLKC